MTSSRFKSAAPLAPSILRASLVALAAFALAGCTDRLATGSTISDDYRARHPIVLREKPVTLSIISGPTLDAGSRSRVVQFGLDAREEGAGSVEILIPAGAPNERQARAVAPAIKAALEEGGSALAIHVGSYPASDPRALAPLRVSYRMVRAGLPHSCGQWPADIAVGSAQDDLDNRPHWNFGGSYQNMIATQVEDPRDLQTPRAMTSADAGIRMRTIDRVRKGNDPATTWTTGLGAGIGSVGGAR